MANGNGGFKVQSVELTCNTPDCLNLVMVTLAEYKTFGKPYCAECAAEAQALRDEQEAVYRQGLGL